MRIIISGEVYFLFLSADCDTFGGEKMIKIGLAATNDAAGLDNKNVSAFIELAQKTTARL
jgi:hypothetical protein